MEVPPLTGVGLLWPWIAPWAVSSARGVAEAVPDRCQPFRLVSANALGSNRRPREFADELTAIDTDVLVVVEASQRILDALDEYEVLRYHRHGLVEKRERWGGCGIWSDHPMELVEAGNAGYAYIAARVTLPASFVTIIAVHTVAPTKRGAGVAWRASFDRLAEVVERCEGPVIAAGDYNATLGHGPLRRFLARTGLRDAHTAAGRGLARTWPASGPLPPLGLIDRVLVSADVSVASITERALPGSDHFAVLSTLAVPRTDAP
jgi:endonuclease/exonuclease/phosphatase (EEP) superfamily protein YafD